MSEDNVHALPGYCVPSNKPVQGVIEILEGYLEQARAGRIIAVAAVTVTRDPLGFHWNWVAEQNSRHSLVAGVSGLNWALAKVIAEDE